LGLQIWPPSTGLIIRFPAVLQMAASLLIRRSAVERRLEAGNEGA
jgi:hypothetical protein